MVPLCCSRTGWPRYADEGKTPHDGDETKICGDIYCERFVRMIFKACHTCNMIELMPHLMHQRWPWGVQQGWQQQGGAAETAMKKGKQRVTLGQPAAALALLAKALAVVELWGRVVVKWSVLLEAELLQSTYQSPQQCLLHRYKATAIALCNSWCCRRRVMQKDIGLKRCKLASLR